jgi:hypothetical protein
MKASVSIILLLAATAHAETPPVKPAEATCRSYLEQGLALQANKDYINARARFHTARIRCANLASLVMIARTYEEQGDLPRALAYLETFLASAGPDDELRKPVEGSATALRERVAETQRVDITQELVAAQGPSDLKSQLSNETDTFVEPTGPRITVSTGAPDKPRVGRRLGMFFGGNIAYATTAQMDVTAGEMSARTEFSTVFAAELHGGYRVMPYLSVGLASQLLFHLQPEDQPSANQLGVFAQATGHIAVAKQWDIDAFVAPGYGVLFIPEAPNAKGPAFRWGGGPVFHLTDHLSFAGEFSQQTGFLQRSNIDVKTSFVSLFVGVRVH